MGSAFRAQRGRAAASLEYGLNTEISAHGDELLQELNCNNGVIVHVQGPPYIESQACQHVSRELDGMCQEVSIKGSLEFTSQDDC